MSVTFHPDTEQAAVERLWTDAVSLEQDAAQIRRLLQLVETGRAVVVMAANLRDIEIDVSDELIDEYDLCREDGSIIWQPVRTGCW